MTARKWHEHLDPEEVFLSDEFGDLSLARVQDRWLHQLFTCPACRRRAFAFLGVESLEEAAEHELLPLIEAALARREAEEGAAFVAWLETLPAAERGKRLATDPKLGRPAVARALLARCRSCWAAEPHEALAWSALAAQAAAAIPERLDYARDELQGLAWAYRGNVLRILSDLPEAARCFAEARRKLAPGTVEDLVLAEARSLEASLLADQRRFDQALAALDQAATLYEGYERWHLLGRVLLKRAKLYSSRGDSAAALAELDAARPLLRLDQEPRLGFVVASISVHCLCDLGRYGEAEILLPEAFKVTLDYGTALDLLRIKWCAGQVAAARGDSEEAEASFREVRAGFFEQGITYDAALVSLDLAALYLAQGRTREIRCLAAEMLPIFESQQVAGEALAALCLFTQAALTDQLTRDLMARVRQRLERSRSGE